MSRSFPLFAVFALGLCAAASGAEEEAPYFAIESIPAELPATNTVDFSLEGCVIRALEVNYDVLLVKRDVDVAGARILQERGVFEPALFGEGSTSGSDAEDAEDRSAGQAGIRTRLVTGTDISIAGSFSETGDEDDADPASPDGADGTDEDEARARIEVAQPLLRRAGIRVTKSNLLIARTNRAISLHEMARQMIDTATDVENTYWDLVSVRESLAVEEESLRFARDLQTMVRQRAVSGLVPESDIVEAEAEVYGREASVAQAGESVRSTEDRLKESLALFEEPRYWNGEIVPSTAARAPDRDPEFLPALRLAMAFRPDYRAEMLRLKNDDLSLYVAKNGLLPRLDLVADTDLTRPGGDAGAALDALTDSDEQIWSVLLRLEIPLGNKAARGDRDEARAQREQRILRLKQIELGIIREVRRAVDAVRTGRRVVEAQAKAVESEQIKLDNEQEKLRLGKSDTDTVVRFIQSLNSARLNHIQAVVRYNQALAILDQVQGTTLERFGVTVEK